MGTQRDSPLPQLIDLLTPYDPAHLLSSIAALQLLPRNADQAVRLEVLTHAAASLPFAEGKPQISSGRLRQICDSSELSSFSWAEDPCDEIFVEEILFFGGSFLVMPGITENASFILRHICRAIFLNTVAFPDRAFIRAARQLISAALTISNEVALRAGLHRGTPPSSAFKQPIVVPSAAVLNDLRASVDFDNDQLANALQPNHVKASSLERYVLRAGDCSAEGFMIGSSPIHARPLVREGKKWIVASPGSLLAAARHHVILTALEHGSINELARRYCGAVWMTVTEALNFLQHHEMSIGTPPGWNNDFRADGLFTFDDDKLLYAMLATDPCRDYAAGEVYGHWKDAQLREDVESHILKVEQEIFRNLPWVNEVLVLFLFQSVGRSSVLGFSKLPEHSRFLAMTAADLETIALLEGGDPLALWKYAGAARRLREKTHLIVTGELDEFHTFRRNGHSFYISDDRKPDVLTIPPGEGGALRREVAQERDWHGVPSFRRGYFRQVTALHDTSEIPVYAPYPLDDQICLLVEGSSAFIWIIAPAQLPAENRYLRSLYATLVDGFAYWIWQLAPILRQSLSDLAGQVIVVDLTLVPDDAWQRARDYTPEEIAAAFALDANVDRKTISITLTPALNSILGAPDNSGERELISRLLKGFAQLLPEERRRQYLSDKAMRDAVERYAPLGLKKKLLFLSAEKVPQLDNRGLPRYRLNQEADTNELLDRLGVHLSKHYATGAIAPAEANHVMKESVRFCLSELQKLVESLAPEGTLEYLIAQHEAIVRQDAFSSLTIPTRLACYGGEPEMQKQLAEEIPRINSASLAGRFLIEFVSALPPRGYRPISLSCFDEMRALSSHLINDGMLSDLLHFKLFDLKLSILPSGRRGIDDAGYRAALENHMRVFASDQISRSSESFGRHWEDRTAKSSESMDELEKSVRAEWGHSLTDLLTFLTSVMRVGYQVDRPVLCIPISELISRVTSESDLSTESATAIFELLALRNRASLFEVQAPFRSEDAYPWRFNRSLSYLRRPLVVRRTEAEDEVLWGNRHVDQSRKYLVQIITSGRVRAQSSELRAWLGKIHNKDGDRFNAVIAEFVAGIPGMVVRPKFKKLKTASGPKRAPGDIDVLVLDPRSKIIYPLECKSLSAARTPFELATELDEMLGTPGSNSMIEKHERRVQWCRQNLRSILEFLHIESKGRWSIKPYVVVAQPLLTAHVRESPIPIITFDQLKILFNARHSPR